MLKKRVFNIPRELTTSKQSVKYSKTIINWKNIFKQRKTTTKTLKNIIKKQKQIKNILTVKKF